jgi:hypothetical protein
MLIDPILNDDMLRVGDFGEDKLGGIPAVSSSSAVVVLTVISPLGDVAGVLLSTVCFRKCSA